MFHSNGEIRAVILKIYHMPNGLTSMIHEKFHQISREMRNALMKKSLKKFEVRPSKLKKSLLSGSGETDCR